MFKIELKTFHPFQEAYENKYSSKEAEKYLPRYDEYRFKTEDMAHAWIEEQYFGPQDGIDAIFNVIKENDNADDSVAKQPAG